MVRQMSIPFKLIDAATFEYYMPDLNAWAVNALLKWSKAQVDESFCYCWGPWGVGKTHLLNAVCHEALALSAQVFYLDCAHHRRYCPSVLEDLDAFDLICLDNIDVLMGMTSWETALFNVYNQSVIVAEKRLLVTASLPPAQIGVQLPDLRSRLLGGWVLSLSTLSEQGLQEALMHRALQRGFHFSEHCAEYLLKYWTRCPHCLFRSLDDLDHLSLSAQRRITIPFIKSHWSDLKRCEACTISSDEAGV
ncbi:MAG: DnaA regulatory inactivator Hda [Legionellales bacterium]|nr:DnaA regulatory inactivator Hda [Legionellales bacterium]|tara:strand:+ start:2189 stop:2935 length:747 start_codon:yes stop_codon:yes gene_type:complete